MENKINQNRSGQMTATKKIFSSIFVSLIIFASVLLSISMVSAYASPAAVNLGTAGNFVILAKSGISTTGTTAVTGDIGVSPIDSTAITGFGLTMDSSNTFSTSSLVTGKVYAADYTAPTPATMTTAVSDMQTAFTAATSPAPDATELGAGDISGMTLAPGVYKWGTGLLINGGVTLDAQGDPNAVWIFQIAQDLTVGNGAIITLSGGAQASNVFWVVSGQAILGTTSNFKGNILSQTNIDIQTGAILNGRALAQTAVTLDANAITSPGTASSSTPTTTSSGGSNGGGSTSPTTPTVGETPTATAPTPTVTSTTPITSSATTPTTTTSTGNAITNTLKSPTSKTIMIIIGILVLGLLAYFIFRKK